ncbi:MAG: hypothetical protein ACRCXT_16920 [Paraclostridium sp.]
MKINKSILNIIVILILSICLITGCIMLYNSSRNIYEIENQVNEEVESIKLFEEYSKQMKSLEGVYEVKQDLANKFSKAITDGGLEIIDSTPDGSFVVSLGNVGKETTRSIQSLNYSMSEDYKQGKARLNILCAKEYTETENLNENDKYIKSIYSIFKSLTNHEISEEEFFRLTEDAFSKGEVTVELPYQDIIPIQVVKVKKSEKYVKTIQLNCIYEFDIPKV